MFSVARTYLHDANAWPALQRYNGVQQDRQMPSGYKIRIPLAWLRTLPAEANVIDFQGEVEIVAVGDGTVRPAQRGMRLKSGTRCAPRPAATLRCNCRTGLRCWSTRAPTWFWTRRRPTREPECSRHGCDSQPAASKPKSRGNAVQGGAMRSSLRPHTSESGGPDSAPRPMLPRKSHAAKFWTGWSQ